ncbi:hypothetical protein GCM10022381_39400 [Leifsonia kafniensis]|uniref:FtsK domain-containing protein n=1 Tax=Leifsonia kafniensis TaxID=475957 RepID=A0ABP7L2I0_9MICO
MSHPLSPLRLPALPAEPAPAGFPLIASVAPLAAAAVIWGLTGSVFALVFAGLSPIMAVAGLLDGRRTRRRARRQGAAAYDAAIAELRVLAAEQQAQLRIESWERTPSAASILAAHDRTAYWPSDGMTEVSVGCGSIDGGLRVDGADTTPEHRALSLEIATLTEAPIVVDAMHGIGVVGSVPLARALARALVIQLCTALPPTRCGFNAASSGWEWASLLPHADSATADRDLTVWEHGEPCIRGAGERMLIAVASHVTALPPGCDTIVQVHGPDRAEVVRSAVLPRGLVFRPELIATAEAGRFAAVLRQQALVSGLLPAQSRLPEAVPFSSLDQQALQLQGLGCTIGYGEHGALSVDLVRNGPHAVIGGTTGSGTSELLVTWILAMAATRSVHRLNFLLIDFKGGAAFAPLVALPHCVGLVTDLEAGEATRALHSLAAELRHRERVLRDAEARDIDDLPAPGMPRLVIVVDEFATMLDAFPALHTLFVDIAARGRSLGVHLILCTQRPAGVVRDALLANCSLPISLRVNNRADSLALLGTDAAAGLPATSPGRALVDTAEGEATLCQIATTDQDDLAGIVAAHRGRPPARRPWLQPLPTELTATLMRQIVGAAEYDASESNTTGSDAAVFDSAGSDATLTSGATALTLGLLDEPEHQRYRVARYSPTVDGHLLVLGSARSGKSAALALIEREALAAGLAVERVGADVERAWDLLEFAHRRSAGQNGDAARKTTGPDGAERGMGRALLLLFDDFDSVLARWEPEHRQAALDLLAAVLRDGAAARITCIVSTQRVANGLQLLPTLCPSSLLLRMASREDYLAAGGLAERFDPALPPGGGVWRERRIQLLTSTDGDLRGEGATSAAATTAVARAEAAPPVTAAPAAEASEPAAPGAALPLAPFGAPTHNLIVVAGAPAQCAERFRRFALAGQGVVVELAGIGAGAGKLEVGRAAGSTVFVGDVDAWQTEWALLQALRPRATMVFDGCSLADFRQINRRRQLPPPLAPSRGHLWLSDPDGTVRRGVMPG